MKKGFAILCGVIVLCCMTSCSRTPDVRADQPAKIERARSLFHTSEKPDHDAEFHKAKALLLEILSNDPNNPEANKLIADLYYHQGEKLMDNLSDEASLTELEIVQSKRVIFLQKALLHLNKINENSALKKTIEKELYMSEE